MLASQHTTITDGDRAAGKRDFRDIPKGVIGSEERLALLWDRGVVRDNNSLLYFCGCHGDWAWDF